MRKLLVEFLAFGSVALVILVISIIWNHVEKRKRQKDEEQKKD